jgi:hypothetical protein
MDATIWESAGFFEWIQPTLHGPHFLTVDGREAGSLIIPSWIGSVWHGETSFGRWKFEGVGFWSRRYEVRDLETDRLIATYAMRWHASRGTLTLPDEQRFEWLQKSWFKRTCVFVDGRGCEVVSVRMGRERGKKRGSRTCSKHRERSQPAPARTIPAPLVCWFSPPGFSWYSRPRRLPPRSLP